MSDRGGAIGGWVISMGWAVMGCVGVRSPRSRSRMAWMGDRRTILGAI
ncbi:MAG: hypothetical protein HC860_13990 [Alkalinema sp. RU_4_3]|nr:hypothetical protein [Alkalinema sp. RU_4_3]